MTNRKNIITSTLVFLFVSYISVFATDVNLGIKGARTFAINGNVGQAELKFVSTAPLEEIIGYADAAQVKSTFTLDPTMLEKISGKISFPVVSIETGIKTRNGHLQSEAWLDAAKYPEISFELKEFQNVKIKGFDNPSGRVTVLANAVGTYSMHGKSKSISVPVTMIYIKESDASKKRASGDLVSIEGAFEVKLKDFAVEGKQGVVGSKVGETIKISFKLYYNGK